MVAFFSEPPLSVFTRGDTEHSEPSEKCIPVEPRRSAAPRIGMESVLLHFYAANEYFFREARVINPTIDGSLTQDPQSRLLPSTLFFLSLVPSLFSKFHFFPDFFSIFDNPFQPFRPHSPIT